MLKEVSYKSDFYQFMIFSKAGAIFYSSLHIQSTLPGLQWALFVEWITDIKVNQKVDCICENSRPVEFSQILYIIWNLCHFSLKTFHLFSFISLPFCSTAIILQIYPILSYPARLYDLSVMAKSKYYVLCETSLASPQLLHFRHFFLLVSMAAYTPLSATP